MRAILPNLVPNTKYELQLKALGYGNRESDWSPKFSITTAKYLVKPQIPTQVTWKVDGSSFFGTWQSVTHDEENQPVNVVAYDVQVTPVDEPELFSTVTVPFGSGIISYILLYEENIALFGTAKGAINFKVRAVDVRGTRSDWSDTLTAQNEPPEPPTNFVATGGADSIAMTWTASPAEDLAGYRVYVGNTEDFLPSLGNRIYQGESTSFTYGTSTYAEQFFKLVAYDMFGIESVYLEDSATPTSPFTLDVEPPQKPLITNVTLTNNDNGVGASADITWSPTTGSWPEDLSGFIVKWRLTGSTRWSQTSVERDTDNAVIAVPKAYSGYDFQILAYDFMANYSTPSVIYTAEGVVGGTPNKITAITSTSARDSIAYAWAYTAPLDLDYYEVRISTNVSFSNPVAFKTGNSQTLTVGGLDPAKRYYFQVRAHTNAGKIGNWSDIYETLTLGQLTAEDIGAVDTTYVNNILNRKITHSDNEPDDTPNQNDIWIQYDEDDNIIGQWRGDNGQWISQKIESQFIASLDAGVITANTSFTSDLNVRSTFTLGAFGSPGVIKSYDYSSNKGFSLSSNGLVINEGSVKVDTLTGGEMSGTGVINIGLGTSLVMNGGVIKSNTYTGTSSSENPSGAGFYLGDDGIRVDSGAIYAEAFAGGTFDSGTIQIGDDGYITGPGFEISGAGIFIENGVIEASALALQTGPNIIPPAYSSFEYTNNFYDSNIYTLGQLTKSISTDSKYGNQSYSANWSNQSFPVRIYMSTHVSQYNIVLEPDRQYILSGYFWVSGQGATVNLGIRFDNGNEIDFPSVVVTETAPYRAVRTHGSFTVPNNTTSGIVYVKGTSPNGNVFMDGFQLEKKIGTYDQPSAWQPSGMTRIDGDAIRTGSIRSNVTTNVSGNLVPLWSIDLQGDATFANARIRGNTIVGPTPGTTEAGSWIQSSLYTPNTTGWRITSTGDAFFMNATVKGLITGSEIRGGTISATTTIQGALQTDTRTNRGLLLSNSGLTAYNSSSAVTFQLNGETGAIKMSGDIDASGASILGANITGTSSINGVNVSGGTITGATIQTSAGGARVYMLANQGKLYIDSGNGTGAVIAYGSGGMGFQTSVGHIFGINQEGTTVFPGGLASIRTNGDISASGITLRDGVFAGTSNSSLYNLDIRSQLRVSTEAFFDYVGAAGQTGPASFNGNQKLIRTPSTRKAKKYISNLEDKYDYDTIISLEPKQYKFKSEWDMGDRYYSGFIAEDAHELGLKNWVSYDENNEPAAFYYAEYTSALQIVVREQDRRIKELSARLDKYEDLDERLKALESKS